MKNQFGWQVKNQFAKIRRPTLRQGLFWGLILGLIEVAFNFLSSYINFGDFSTTIAWALFLVFGFLAGQRAAREVGKITTGAIAGLYTGLIGAFIYSLVYFIFVLPYLPYFVNLAKTHLPQGVSASTITPEYVLANIGILLVFEIIFDALIAVLGGAIGGVLGRRQGPVASASPAYQEALFEQPDSEANEPANSGE